MLGSSGSGRFSDYSGKKGQKGGTGGSSGKDPCTSAFQTILEEVEQCAYFEAHKDVPPEKTKLNLILRGRLFAVDKDGDVVGALNTSFNYLAACMENGFQYVGFVNVSRKTPSPFVQVDFRPTKV